MGYNMFLELFERSHFGIILMDHGGFIKNVNDFASKKLGYHENDLLNVNIEEIVFVVNDLNYFSHKVHNIQKNIYEFDSPLHGLVLGKKQCEVSIELDFKSFELEGEGYMVLYLTDKRKEPSCDDKVCIENNSGNIKVQLDQRTQDYSEALAELRYVNDNLLKEKKLRKKVERQAQKSLIKEKELNALMSKFVSVASHEFRTPLSCILTSISLIDRYNGDANQNILRHVASVKESVNDLTYILEEFLCLEKLEQENVQIKPTEFNIKEYIDELICNNDTVKDVPRSINYKSNHEEVLVYQDQAMIKNIFENLMGNAINYSPANSIVEIYSYVRNGLVEIMFKDKGVGISEKDQGSIFELFFRGENVSTIPGTGIGLNIAKISAGYIKGLIEFESSVEQGTTFIITFPMEYKR